MLPLYTLIVQSRKVYFLGHEWIFETATKLPVKAHFQPKVLDRLRKSKFLALMLLSQILIWIFPVSTGTGREH